MGISPPSYFLWTQDKLEVKRKAQVRSTMKIPGDGGLGIGGELTGGRWNKQCNYLTAIGALRA